MIPNTVTIPARSTVGQVFGNLNIVDNYTVKVNCSTPLYIPDNYYCHLVNASYPYSYPNIAGQSDALPGIPFGNNRISIDYNGGGYVDYTIPTGLYSFTDIAYALNQIAIAQGWQTGATNLFTVNGVQATQTIILSLNPAALTGSAFPVGGINISFANPSPVSGLNDSLGQVLGFNNTTLVVPGGGTSIVSFQGTTTADFANITAYVLNCSLLVGSYYEGASGQILYSFPLGADAPNSIVAYQPALKFEVPALKNNFSSYLLWFTDQLGNKLKLEFFDADILITFALKKYKS